MLKKQSIPNKVEKVAAGVSHLKIIFVNTYFVETPDSWVLVDTGMPYSDGKIIGFAEKIYGKDAKPAAIILTG